MAKTCTKCKQQKELTEFTYVPSKKRHEPACKVCENARKKAWADRDKTSTKLTSIIAKLPKPLIDNNNKDLPEPDQLPAPYAKRVYEMWRSLIGESNSVVRIA